MTQALLHHTDAIAHLQQADPVLGHIIARCGPCTLQPRDMEPFVMLCRSIVYHSMLKFFVLDVPRR
jgi:hypothetical protein